MVAGGAAANPTEETAKLPNKRALTSFIVVGWKRGTQPKTRVVQGYSEGQVLRDLREQYPGWQLEVKAARNMRNPKGEEYGYHCTVPACQGAFHRNVSRIGIAHDPKLLKAHIEKVWGKKD